MYKTVFAMGEG